MIEQTPTTKLITKLNENSRAIRMSRVPAKTKKAFIELANLEFEEDYGMCLKDIWTKAQQYEELKQQNSILIRLVEEKLNGN